MSFLKIEDAFVENINHDVVDLIMVESINRIGHLVDKHTIAGFAVNDAITHMLNQIGVDYA